MRMADRHNIKGTSPAITIGHRIYRDRHGDETVSQAWQAEYWLGGRQRSKSLDTTNKAAAIRAAITLSRKLDENPEHQVTPKRVPIEQAVAGYLEMQENQGRAPKTLEKYRCVLKAFLAWGAQAAAALLYGSDDYLILHNVACIYAEMSRMESPQPREDQAFAIQLLTNALNLWRKHGKVGDDELQLIKSEPAFQTDLRSNPVFQKLLAPSDDDK